MRRDPDRIQRANVTYLIVELDPPAAGEDDVDLLGLRVAV
jgi:hypothetical protein